VDKEASPENAGSELFTNNKNEAEKSRERPGWLDTVCRDSKAPWQGRETAANAKMTSTVPLDFVAS
jgi:hypothetical protein